MMPISSTVKQLIIVNVIFFVGSMALGEQAYDLFAMHFPKNEKFQFWQIITHMFMHGGIAHIAFNMFALWMFGSPLEQLWGRNKFLFFYFSAGLGAIGLHLGIEYYQYNQIYDMLVSEGMDRELLNSIIMTGKGPEELVSGLYSEQVATLYNIFNTPLVGASGAIYGILVAFAFMFPNAQLMLIFLPIPIKAKYFVPLLVLGDLFFGFSSTSTGVAHFAHVGGAMAGFIMMWYWKKNQFKENRWDR